MGVPREIMEKHAAMVRAMRARGRVLVAFSGGVDSGLVAKVARDALGADALAVISDAESLSRRELEGARAAAAEIAISLRVVATSELADPSYASNPVNRCYFCRSGLASELVKVARQEGFPVIADGLNASDLGDQRPGIRAMDEAGVWHPLVEFGLAKPDVRALARSLGLSFHDKPNNACLSSRIPHGTPITVEVLRRVEAAEGILRDRGFRQVRVRHHGDTARIEVLPEEIRRLEAIHRDVAAELRDLGYAVTQIDPMGYRANA